jgi:hypothetical protein
MALDTAIAVQGRNVAARYLLHSGRPNRLWFRS